MHQRLYKKKKPGKSGEKYNHILEIMTISDIYIY